MLGKSLKMTDQLIKTMHLYKDEHIKDGRVHLQRIMQRWDGVPTAEYLLDLGITFDILHLSAFCTQNWAGHGIFVCLNFPAGHTSGNNKSRS